MTPILNIIYYKFPNKQSIMTIFEDFEALKAGVGNDFGYTPYITVTQDMIDHFAKATLDKIGRASCRERV